jgi:hypothetical protein
MRKALVALLSVCLLAFVVGSVSARDAVQNGLRIYRDAGELEVDRGLADMYSAAAVDTYCIVWYNFEPSSWQGFTTQDMTAQVSTWFHADDFAGLAGGTGHLYPIEGSISIWCGARPGTDPYLCGWYYAPGYGNNWNQMLKTEPFPFVGALYLSYHGVFDSEYDYDFCHVEYDLGNENWVNVASWDESEAATGIDTIVTHQILIPKAETKLRFHFTSDGAMSDEDGRGNYDGTIIDSITIYDSRTPDPLINFEDFEDWTVGAFHNGLGVGGDYWEAWPEDPYGSFIGLATNLQDKDPCGDNYGSQIIFFVGSPNPSASYPGLYDTPFCQGPGGITAPCQYEIAISPPIDMTKYSTGENSVQDADIDENDLDELGGTLLRFTVYRDLPSANNVFYVWHVRILDPVTLCPGVWQDRNYVYYGPDMDYIFSTEDVSLFTGGNDPIQVALGCIDYCEAFYENPGDCLYHTPSPWIDNIRVYRYKTSGPQWNYRALETFQDNFPENDFAINTSWVRADAADDKAAGTDPYFIPGDSVNVTCTSPLGGGIRENLHGGEVYLHVAVRDVSGFLGKPNLYGPSLEGTYGVYVEDDGSEWTILQCDTAMTQYTNPVPDQWCVDLNDSLLTRGYEVEYYFKAYDNLDNSSTLPRYAEEGYTWEFTCLPTGRSKVLYVDDFHARGSRIGLIQQYWNPTFEAVIPAEEQPDVYDINAPTSMVANGLSSRATLNHLLYNDIDQYGYTIIIWDSGDLDIATIGDGNPTYEKTDDCTLLINWLNQSGNDVGLLVCGDDIAFDLYAFGGCPVVNSFDVIATTQEGAEALMYPEFEEDAYVAGIQSEQDNSLTFKARTVWLAFSWMQIRDTEPSSPIVRNLLFNEIYEWFQGTPNSNITPADVPAMYRLAQNFPNPFNPTTRIAFDIPKKGHVSLKIYNVAGQLVKTLVDGVLDANHHEYEWMGTNNAGVKVASGVYFYSIEADNFTSTKKMVLLR